VLLNRPGKSAGFQDLPGSSANPPESFEAMPAAPQPIEATHARPDIGPPPFPLNLLPEDQLKEFIRGRRNNQVEAPPSYFGSCHNQSTIANLPPSGFHSFVAPARAQFGGARYGPVLTRVVSQRKAVPVRHFSHKTPVSHHQAVIAHTQVSAARVLLYPPY